MPWEGDGGSNGKSGQCLERNPRKTTDGSGEKNGDPQKQGDGYPHKIGPGPPQKVPIPLICYEPNSVGLLEDVEAAE